MSYCLAHKNPHINFNIKYRVVRNDRATQYNIMIKDLLLYFALLLWFVVPLQAQPTIFAEDITANEDEIVEVEIKVEGFKDIVAWQFTFEWDSQVLEFIDFDQFNLVDLSEDNFGPTDKTDYIISTWFENLLTPVSVADGEVIFSIKFKVIGEAPDSSKLWFSGRELENIVSENGTSKDFETRMGVCSVITPTNAVQTILPNFDLSISPNPFRGATQVKFNLENNQDDFNVSIHTLDGKQIYNQEYDLPAGEHIIDITSDMIPTSGMYLLHFTGEGLYTTQKLIFENY